jgi:hypothetical protein
MNKAVEEGRAKLRALLQEAQNSGGILGAEDAKGAVVTRFMFFAEMVDPEGRSWYGTLTDPDDGFVASSLAHLASLHADERVRAGFRRNMGLKP